MNHTMLYCGEIRFYSVMGPLRNGVCFGQCFVSICPNFDVYIYSVTKQARFQIVNAKNTLLL